ncbi:MAG: preprotein translocase subunit SecE [Solirubrobacterales bacterium]|nr:preprotein translocase subunit SecE [Solirubrobacterales bacterium]
MARKRQRARERKEKLHRENVPGELEHASAEVDQFESALVAGAGGEPLPEDSDALDREQTGPGAGDIATTPVKDRSGSRLVNFIRACWAELQRVQWPDRRQVGQATAVVLGFVVMAGAFLGLADVVAEKIVDLIL